MGTLWQDIRLGFRQLWKNPGFTAVAVISLGLGLGANAAIFSLVNAILLRSLPVPNPQELRILKWSGTETKIGNFSGSWNSDSTRHVTADAFSYPVLSSLRDESHALAEVFGYHPLHSVTLRSQREPFVAQGSMVSDNFFSALGVHPQLGRLLSAEDEQDGAAPTVVISHALWEREFALDPGVLGRTLLVNNQSFVVVGVLPREFAGLCPADRTAFYVSMAVQPQLQPSWPRTATDVWWVQVMARLKPATTVPQFQAALDVAFARLTTSLMKTPKVLLQDGRGGPSYDRKYYRKPLLLLLGVVGTALLIACANVAGLSLARGAARQHEGAVRAALGAGRWRLMRPALTESLLLSLFGAGLGLLLALWGKEAISRLIAGSAEGLHYDTALDLNVLGFLLAVALTVALLSGLLPALGAANVNPLAGLKDRAVLGAARLRTGRVLVAAQIALSLLLLTGAGLYVRTLVNLVRINPGFATENLLLFQLLPRQAGYRGARLTQFYDRAQQSLAAIPGVRSATLTQFKLLGGTMSGGNFFTLPGRTGEGESEPRAHRLTVSETFFVTMGLPVLVGRGFSAGDVEGTPRVVVVNETFARRYLSAENPLGQILQGNDGRDWQIVGVCRDAKYTGIKNEVPSTVYFSFRQDSPSSAYFALRTAMSPLAVVTAARKAVAAVDPGVPLADITTQKQVRDKRISQERLFATLCGALAGLALLLSCLGLYGLTAYNVARRTSEIGLRMALGATPRHVAAPVLREALLLSLVGVVVGLPAAFAAGRVIRSQLYGVQPHDPLALAAAVAALVAVALLAAWLPARRAARTDPMEALRYE